MRKAAGMVPGVAKGFFARKSYEISQCIMESADPTQNVTPVW